MGTPMEYDAPNLEDDVIGESIRLGMLGDDVRHITIEQLRSAQPALLMQLCVSILQKLNVDTNHLEQAYLQPELSHPEYFSSATFLAVHIPKLFHMLIPGCTPKKWCTSDLLRPKWGRIRKFLSIIINFLRCMENTIATFDEINANSEETHHKVEQLADRNKAIKKTLNDVEDYMISHASAQEQQQKELGEADTELQQLKDITKQEKHLEKEEIKQVVSNSNKTFEDFSAEYENIMKEVEAAKVLVVSSPRRLLSEKEALKSKLFTAQEESVQVQDAFRLIQWKVDQEKQLIQRLEYVEKQISDSQEFLDKIRVLQTGLMNKQFQTESDNMALTRLTRELNKLKQEISDQREISHKTKLRLQKQLTSGKHRLQEINKEKDLVTSQAKTKGERINSLMSSLEEENKNQANVQSMHSDQIKKLEAVQVDLQNCADDSCKKTADCFKYALDEQMSQLKKL